MPHLQTPSSKIQRNFKDQEPNEREKLGNKESGQWLETLINLAASP